MRVGIGKLSLKKKKYLHHNYKIDGEDLPNEKNTINKKALAFSSAAVLFPLSVLNFIAGTYKSIINDLSKTVEKPTIFDVFGADWEKSVSIKNAFLPVLPTNVYLVSLLASTLVGFLVYSKINYRSDENVAYGQKGDSRFTTIEEIIEQYREIPEKTEVFEGYGGVPVSHYKDKYYIDTDTVNTAILGVSRSGKGEMIVVVMIDNLSRAKNQSSMVINDPKGELYSASKETLEKRGYDVQVLNILDPLQGMSYNPLQLVIDAWVNGDDQEAAKRANTLTFSLYNDPNAGDNAFFNTSAQNAINGIILAIVDYCVKNDCIEKVTMHNVSQMLNELGTFYYKENPDDFIEKNALDEYFKSLPQGNVAKMQYGSTSFAGEKAKGSILATANQGLQTFADKMFAKMTSKSSLDLKQVGFPKNLFFQLDERFLNKRVTVSFHKNDEKKTEIGSYKIKVKALGMCNMNFDETLEDGDLLLIRYQDEEDPNKKYRLLYRLKFEKLLDEKGRVVYQKKEGFEDKPEYKRQVILNMMANTFPLKPKTKLSYSDKPTAVFMIVPDYDKSNHALASIFVKQLYTELSMNCNDTKGKKCYRRVHFLLDEFGNMPPIDDMGGVLTVCAGRNMLFNLVLQSYSQIEKLYDKEATEIKDNCQNHIYIMSTNKDTIEEISLRAGHKTPIGKSSNESHMEADNKLTKNADQQRIITPERLSQFIEGETLVLRALHRQDINRKKVRAYPIFNTKETSMPYRWQFLGKDFDTSRDLNEIDIPSLHTGLDLTDLYLDFLDFILNKTAKKEYMKKQQANPVVKEQLTIDDVVKSLIGLVKEKRNLNDTEDIRKRLIQMLLNYAKDNIVPKTEEIAFLIEHSSDHAITSYLEELLKILTEQ
ncbi:VirD4-like conjugal transfer protein, CD1115 family [Bacillus thuringiensis]|uniref:VirD4-like conjugal transfer protein, CD1115 family n=1 Tax=Bacillus thuringiensis TaxID=1428 RepID=UPI000B44A23A|nr:type IV secretory system conjugative DNA transfer family protein [Bacillus thuringiensis]OTY11424.1 conjugal transfer protein [Bacillus thuringiensis serovar kim]OUB15133.1 conjugal transfer protein [Bacillus thuringiensis serovar xiaguangiensis]OUB15217.1 conjugal transfer protein [Bacillus thuringiensis serovar xiaguangiensis]